MNETLPPETKSCGDEAIRAIVREAVAETLMRLGFDATHPTDLQADMYHLRRLRRMSEEAGGSLRRSLIAIATTSTLTLLWEAIRHRLFTGSK